MITTFVTLAIYKLFIVTIGGFSLSSAERKLHLITCETENPNKANNPQLASWNISSEYFTRVENISRINACTGKSWAKYRFLSKPIFYRDILQTLIANSTNISQEYVIMMDSDTIFRSNITLSEIFSKFDKISAGKNIVISSEMSCYVGSRCSSKEVSTWYPNANISEGNSIFLNSGLMMGKAISFIPVLDYIIEHNKDYDITKRGKFEDQKAFTDYTFRLFPNIITLDYNQELFASFPSYFAYPGFRNRYTCKSLNHEIVSTCDETCFECTPAMAENELKFLVFDESICSIFRNKSPAPHLLKLLSNLAEDPLIWHGNGLGKDIYNKMTVYMISLRVHHRMTVYMISILEL
eukprot:gene6473-13072_t